MCADSACVSGFMEQLSMSSVCLKKPFKIGHGSLGEELQKVGEESMGLPMASVCSAPGEEAGLREEDSVWGAWKGHSPLTPAFKGAEPLRICQ